MAKRFWNWITRTSLWLVSIGLMLASSGIDGAYLARIMPANLDWLGYVLNTMSDIGSEVLMYWFGRLRLFPKNSKRYRMAVVLLPAELLIIAYSWFFSWRQLLLIMPAVEPQASHWVAPVAAGFIPLLLSAIGYAQALLAGRIESEQSMRQAMQKQSQAVARAMQEQTHAMQEVAQSVALSEQSDGHNPHVCEWCGREFASRQAISAHLRFCDAYQEAMSEQSKAYQED